jgi:hypothetical protein
MSRGALEAGFPFVGAAASSAGLTIKAIPPAARKPRRLIFFVDAGDLDFTGVVPLLTEDYPRLHRRARPAAPSIETQSLLVY